MPIYEYVCQEGHRHERWESFDAPSEHSCPECGATSRRLLSIPAVIFKGSGFYSTDNRRGDPSPSTDSPKKDETAKAPEVSSTSAEPKSESPA